MPIGPGGGKGATITYATLAAMRAAGVPPDGVSNAILENRAVAYDGGAGDFIWLTNSPAGAGLIDDDTIVIIPVNAPAGSAWIRNFSGPINVLWAGASTALADNSGAFNNAQLAADNAIWGVAVGPRLTHGKHVVGIPAGGTFKVTGNLAFHVPVQGMETSVLIPPIIENDGPGIITYLEEISNLELTGAGQQYVDNARSVIFNSVQIFLTGAVYSECTINAGLNIQIPITIPQETFYSCVFNAGVNVEQNGHSVTLENCNLIDGAYFHDAAAAATLIVNNCTLNMNNVAIVAAGLFRLSSIILVDGLACINLVQNANPILQATNYAQAMNVTGVTTQALSFSINHAATGGASPANVANAPVSGTIYQNTNPWPITVQVSVTYNPLAGAAATLTPALGPVNPPVALPAESEPAGLVVGRVRTYTLLVPCNYFYSFTAVNAVLGAGQITS